MNGNRLGTAVYTAPEELLAAHEQPIDPARRFSKSAEKAQRPCLGKKVDVWSAAVLVLQAASGELPFGDELSDARDVRRRHRQWVIYLS